MKSQTLKCKADQAMDYVIGWMRSGELKVGDRLPPERELCLKLGISRLTLNKAMARLEDAALLNRSAGRGTYVAKLPANDAIAIICDIEHLSSDYHAPSADMQIKCLIESSKNAGLGPHFMVGRGATAKEFIASLNMESSVWREIKGVVAMAWKDGFEERLAEMGIPSVILSSWDQGRHSVILDYEELGKAAFERLVEEKTRKACVVYNGEFAKRDWNSPYKLFASLESSPCPPFQAKMVPIDEFTPWAGERLAASIEETLKACDALFITNDNVAAGFASLFAKRPGLEPKLVISQASAGSPPDLPPSFKRLSFDPADTARLAVEMLKKLQEAGLEESGILRETVKPKFESSI